MIKSVRFDPCDFLPVQLCKANESQKNTSSAEVLPSTTIPPSSTEASDTASAPASAAATAAAAVAESVGEWGSRLGRSMLLGSSNASDLVIQAGGRGYLWISPQTNHLYNSS